MADAKPRKARRVALGTAALALVWLFGVWPPPLWWRDHRPRATAMMREAEGWQAGSSSNLPAVHPTALRDISPVLQRMVIIAEDSRFRTHHGIDPAEIADAVGIDQTKGWRGTIVAAWRDLSLARYRGVEVDIPPAEETDTLQVPAIAPTPVESLPIEAPIPVDTTQDSVTAGRSASVSPPTAAASPAPYSWRGHPSRPAPPSRRARAP